MTLQDAWADMPIGEGRAKPLYGAFYGLNEPPFDLTSNPRFLFLSHRQREALSNLRYALATAKGFSLILGEAGTGKTTLVRTALAEIGNAGKYVLVSNPTLSKAEFYDYLAQSFGLSEAARSSKPRFLAELQKDVESRFAAGGGTGLIIDEAQSLPHELLEEIRLLGNIETTTTKLLNIVLSGQPELADRLNEPSLRQLKQRVALRCQLEALTLDETAAYISGRLRIAGGSPGDIFTRETVIAVYRGSHGIPRTVNVLCDNILITGFAAQARPIPADLVADVCRDFDLGQSVAPVPSVSSDLRSTPDTAMAKQPPRVPSSQPIVDAERPMFSFAAPKPKRRFSFFP